MRRSEGGLLNSALTDERPSPGRWTRRVRSERGFTAQDDVQMFRLILLNPSRGGHRADFERSGEPCETAFIH
jgi:hypothetical protein